MYKRLFSKSKPHYQRIAGKQQQRRSKQYGARVGGVHGGVGGRGKPDTVARI
jgi:hypothetical protein